MKELILEALHEAYECMEKQVPQTKTETKFQPIEGIRVTELAGIIREHNIPEHAEFVAVWDDNIGGEEAGLRWYIDVPTTDLDKLNFRKVRFSNIAFKYVYDKLIANGYKRIGVWSHELKKYFREDFYNKYYAKEYDYLVEYYSLYFTKKEEV